MAIYLGNKKVSVKGYHLWKDTQKYVILNSNVVDKSCNDALDHLNSATDTTSPFTTLSDITNINTDIKKGLYSKNVAIVAPYDLAIAYAEVASENGVNFRLEEEVLNIEKINKGFRVITNRNKFTCKVVINTIADEIYINEKGVVKEKTSEEEEDSFKNMSYILVDSKIPFLRIHQLYPVNYRFICKISFSHVTLRDGTVLQISEDRQKKIM